MPRYLVSCNTEYSIVVEADSEEAAIHEANQIDIDDWDTQAHSPYEAELLSKEEETNP
jgi:hypothetical protein